MSHIGTSGKEHWGYSNEDSPETCKSCKDYARKHRNDIPATLEAYEALPDVISNPTDLKNATKTISKAVKFLISSGYTTADVFGKGPLPFTALKVVNGKLGSFSGGSFTFDAPKNGQPGDWAEIQDGKHIELCNRGFHFTDIRHLPGWAEGGGRRVFRAEIEGPWAGGLDKYVTRKIRLVEELDKTKLVKLANRLVIPNQPPVVTDEDAVARIDELQIRMWFPELITGTDPLVVEVREAAEAEDLDRFNDAKKALLIEVQAIELEFKAAELRGRPTNALARRLKGLNLPAGIHINHYDIGNAISSFAESKYEDRMLQNLEQQRLTYLVRQVKTEIQIEKVLNRDEDPVLAELAALGIVPAPVWG